MAQQSLVSSVRATVERLLLNDDSQPTIHTVAEELKMSPRSLQRHLQAAGIIYRDLLLQVRVDLAQRMLAKKQILIQQISLDLGYKDPSSFSRFFVRMVGMTPQAFRRQHRSTGQSA